MRTALITILTASAIVGTANADEAPGVSSTARDGYYRSEGGYVPALPLNARDLASMQTHQRALLPETVRKAPPRDPATVKIRRFRDESLSAPQFID